MTTEEINNLITKYPLEPLIVPDTIPWVSQFDSESAKINYALVRHYQPTVVVEFGSRGGRCTHDILLGLIANNKPFVIKPYELEISLRKIAYNNLNKTFGDKAPIIGGDITKATDLPKNIDYLFIDNYHDLDTTKWVFEYLLPNHCKPNCLVQIHDIRVGGNYEFWGEPNGWDEMTYMQELVNNKKFPLEKLYWSWENGQARSSSWWIYKPLSPVGLKTKKRLI